MSSYTDLSDNVNDTFTFSLRGKKYEMRYPKTREIEEIQSLNRRLEELDATSPEAVDINTKLNDSIYSFIYGVDHDTDIKEALKDENIIVLKKFNEMIKAELSA